MHVWTIYAPPLLEYDDDDDVYLFSGQMHLETDNYQLLKKFLHKYFSNPIENHRAVTWTAKTKIFLI